MRRSSFYDEWIKFVTTKKFPKGNGSAKDKLHTVDPSWIPNSDWGSTPHISTGKNINTHPGVFCFFSADVSEVPAHFTLELNGRSDVYFSSQQKTARRVRNVWDTFRKTHPASFVKRGEWVDRICKIREHLEESAQRARLYLVIRDSISAISTYNISAIRR